MTREPVSMPATGSLQERFASVREWLRERPVHSAIDLEIAGMRVRVRFGSEALRGRIAPALAHLQQPIDATPEFDVLVQAFGAELGAEAFAPENAAACSENDIWLEEADGVSVPDRVSVPDGVSVIVQRRGHSVSVVEWKKGMGYFLVPSADEMAYLDSAHPLQQILTHWMGRHGRFLVHGAAVGLEQGGLLLLGAGGAGKSTTALLCLEAGLGYAADDHCLVSCEDGPTVHSVYATGKVAVGELGRFPRLAPACETATRPEGDKGVLFFERVPGLPLVRNLRLRALVLPRITGREASAVRPVGAAEAFRAIVASCALHLPGERAAALACYRQLVSELPAYVLELGAELGSTPPVLRGLLQELAG